MAATLATVKNVCTALPWRTPRTLMAEKMKIALMATTRMPPSPSGTKNPMYRATTTAMAATIPECMLQNIAQPQRNPAAGENISRRNT